MNESMDYALDECLCILLWLKCWFEMVWSLVCDFVLNSKMIPIKYFLSTWSLASNTYFEMVWSLNQVCM